MWIWWRPVLNMAAACHRVRSSEGATGVWVRILGCGSRTPGRGAERDAEQDHRAARELERAERVAEGERARGRADQRLEVQERARELRRDARLPVGEQRERQQRAGDREREQRHDRRGATPARAGGPRAPRSAPPRARPRSSAPRSPRSGRGPRSSDGWTTTNVADSVTDSSTSASPPSEAPPPPPPATIPTPASASAKPSHAAGPVEPCPVRRDQRDERRHGADDQRRVADATCASMPAFWSTITRP